MMAQAQPAAAQPVIRHQTPAHAPAAAAAPDAVVGAAAAGASGPLPSNYRPTNCPILTPPQQSGGRRGYNLFVGTLPNTVTKEDVEILFAPFGTLADTYLLKQEGKGRYRCGFVSFREYSSAAHAIATLNGFRVHSNVPPLCVRFANPPKEAAAAAAGVVPASAVTSPASASMSTPTQPVIRLASAGSASNQSSNEGSAPDSPASTASIGPTPCTSANTTPAGIEFLHSRFVPLAASPLRK